MSGTDVTAWPPSTVTGAEGAPVPCAKWESQLRQQDAGLKTCLDRLGRHIGQLQLGASRAPAEALDSDSRPSSGFSELSDGGSCSRSASCASVYSDWGGWLPATQALEARPSVGDWRRRSADETTMPVWRPQATEERGSLSGSMEGTGQLRAMFRPRPVSTGDLDRLPPACVKVPRASTGPRPAAALLAQGTGTLSPELDPKFQRDLVSRGGREVYPYPSPLHAVALQSPLFALTNETAQKGDLPAAGEDPVGPAGLSKPGTGRASEAASARAYIDRLLCLRGRRGPPRGWAGEQGLSRRELPSAVTQGGQRVDTESRPEKLVCASEGGGVGGTAPSRPGHQGPAPPRAAQLPGSLPEERTAPLRQNEPGETSGGPARCAQTRQPCRAPDPQSPLLACTSSVQPPLAAHQTSLERLKTGQPWTKALKISRRASERAPRCKKQLPLLPERQRGAHAAPRPPLGGRPPCRPPSRGGLWRRPTLAGEAPGRTRSESALYPVPFFVPLVVAGQGGFRVSAQALFPFEAAPLAAVSRKKQRRWQSSVEIHTKAHVAGCPQPRRAGGPQARARPRPAHPDTKSESEHWAACTSLFHSTIAETSEDEASDHTANRFGDHESGASDSEGRGGSLALDRLAVAQGRPAWPQGGPRQPRHPVPKLCRIKASKALKTKIRRFQPAALKVMTTV
ncbi:dapper homolog 2 [Tupaia chinensis]|uniref:dapper homolog 2 n=1 Tax=Tupaia chinensis TaxID=246437 RepID=UPI0003C8E670|nr:dapper homolog 2 [Tupaia chinensis]